MYIPALDSSIPRRDYVSLIQEELQFLDCTPASQMQGNFLDEVGICGNARASYLSQTTAVLVPIRFRGLWTLGDYDSDATADRRTITDKLKYITVCALSADGPAFSLLSSPFFCSFLSS